jgi:hypothetical protein
MKRILSTIISLLFFISFGLAQEIENPGFEEWEEVGLGPDIMEPVNWSTLKTSDDPDLSDFGPQVWEKSTDAHSGEYSVKLFNTNIISIQVPGTITNGRLHPNLNPELAYAYTDTTDARWNTPFTSRPDSIVFWMKFFPEENDTLQFQALLHVGACSLPPEFINPENQVGYTRTDLGGTYENWTRIALAFEYFDDRDPEYLLMILTSGNGTNSITGSYGYFDDIEIIEGAQSITENPLDRINITTSRDLLIIQRLPEDLNKDATIEIIDIAGRKIMHANLISDRISIAHLDIENGIYLVKIQSSSFITCRKLYIE